jgi:hypothetical protein
MKLHIPIVKIFSNLLQRPYREEKLDRNSYAASGTIFRISKCFQRSKQKCFIYTSLEKGSLKTYKPVVHVKKVLV